MIEQDIQHCLLASACMGISIYMCSHTPHTHACTCGTTLVILLPQSHKHWAYGCVLSPGAPNSSTDTSKAQSLTSHVECLMAGVHHGVC